MATLALALDQEAGVFQEQEEAQPSAVEKNAAPDVPLTPRPPLISGVAVPSRAGPLSLSDLT